jgi:prepilin-type N-terminal cleavage/methylation domain-containing protein
MNVRPRWQRRGGQDRPGFTLAEVLISITLAGVAVTAIYMGYLLVAQRAEWCTAASAAQAQALRRMEQVRAAHWDPFDPAYPTNANELVAANFPDVEWVLDVPQTGTSVLMGTNRVTITDLSASAPYLKMIQVDCSWSLPRRGPFTNTVITYRTADQ